MFSVIYSCPFFAWHFFFFILAKKANDVFQKDRKERKRKRKRKHLHTCRFSRHKKLDCNSQNYSIQSHNTYFNFHKPNSTSGSMTMVNASSKWQDRGPCVQCTKSKFNTAPLITDHINNKQEQAHICAWHQHGKVAQRQSTRSGVAKMRRASSQMNSNKSRKFAKISVEK